MIGKLLKEDHSVEVYFHVVLIPTTYILLVTSQTVLYNLACRLRKYECLYLSRTVFHKNNYLIKNVLFFKSYSAQI